MVFYFRSNVVDPPAYVYVGKDKFENEDLIKHGWDEDVWMTEGMEWTSIPEDLLNDLAQLTKANSIDGNKKDNVTIIYTPWSNLKKDGSMATGQVSFHNQKEVKKILVPVRANAIVNRLNKTKEEKYPDLRAEKDAMLKQKRKKEQMAREEAKRKEKEEKQKWEMDKQQKDHAYDEWNDEGNMRSNEDFDEDDFM